MVDAHFIELFTNSNGKKVWFKFTFYLGFVYRFNRIAQSTFRISFFNRGESICM